MTTLRFHAPYMEWAKTRPSARYDLAGSNILACRIDELPGVADAIAFEGNNENGYGPLLESIARHYGVAADAVTSAQGASGANFLVFAALLEPGDEVLVETPGYDPLLGAPRLLGAHVRQFERPFANRFALDPERIERALTPRTRVIIITNPHNPSGVLADPAALGAIGEIARRHGAYVLLDEVYLDLVAAIAARDGANVQRTFAGRGEPFVCTNSLTKSYGLSGLRCGWILSSAAVAERIRRTRDVVDGTGSIVSERLAVLAFRHLDLLLQRSETLLATNRAIVRTFLESRTDLEWVSSAGTVVFPRLRGVNDATPFAERLHRERDTAIVPGRFFQAPAHVRIGCGTATDVLRMGLQNVANALDQMRE
jgi:aspartate/methionine/tyrosine aminotransferase